MNIQDFLTYFKLGHKLHKNKRSYFLSQQMTTMYHVMQNSQCGDRKENNMVRIKSLWTT